ncbi:MAG: Ig domain-containing protein [Bacteroidales bacterium]|nr:Ig domain-containing protein [Bacteroidales bacterium]
MNRNLFAILISVSLLFACEKSPQETLVPVSSVTLNKAEITLVEGEEETLAATVKPDNSKDKSVVWESSDEKVASVSNEGKVTAILEGSATITANSGTVSATCQVKVNAKQLEILGLETLQSTTFRVDEPVDLVQRLTVARGGTMA